MRGIQRSAKSTNVDLDRVAAAFAPDGDVARQFPAFEVRSGQARMARAVGSTLRDGGILVVEAGTGTGKSLAYLLPAVEWSLATGEPVVIATRTINLQEQLIGQDLPLLDRVFEGRFRAALLKGRQNYLCVQKANELEISPSLVFDERSRADLSRLLEWRHETEDGSLADLPFVPAPSAWAEVVADHDECLRTRCPSYEACFFYRARREAAAADLLVVNHHLLLADLALRDLTLDDDAARVLPRGSSRVVIDEAHHLEDVGTDELGMRFTLGTIERLAARLAHPYVRSRGLLWTLKDRLRTLGLAEDLETAAGALHWIDTQVEPAVRALVPVAARSFGRITFAVAPWMACADGAEERTVRIVPENRDAIFGDGLDREIDGFATALESLRDDLEPVLARLDHLSPKAAERISFLAAQLAAVGARLAGAAAALRTFLADTSDLCRWISLRPSRGGGVAAALSFAPLEVGPRLNDLLFERVDAVVLCSATLTVERRFDYFFERSGIALGGADRATGLRLESPYRFEEQALLAIPTDLPPPTREDHEPALHEAVARLVNASRGGAFVLFTSHAALVRAHLALASRLRAAGLDVLRQGEQSRDALLQTFRSHGSSVLFATDSFWEGVDVRGDRLRLVILARLPFRVPTEPIQQARVEAIEARGGNGFHDYSLPQAVLKLRQGFGRLIRSSEDRGVVAILDSRIVGRAYGERFLDSLPPAREAIGPLEWIVREVASHL